MVYPTWQSLSEGENDNSLAVVIDVLRASNTIITALNNGAEKILPVTDIEIARQLKNDHPGFLLGGERNCEKIAGFDFGNSPLEYNKTKVLNQTIVLTTSNGSNALKKVKGNNTYIASLANSTAVAKKLSEIPKDIIIVCSGTMGNPSLEDTIAAGKIISKIAHLDSFILNDFARIALGCFNYYQRNILNAILNSYNGIRLQKLGLLADIKYCALEDVTEVIPRYCHNEIYL